MFKVSAAENFGQNGLHLQKIYGVFEGQAQRENTPIQIISQNDQSLEDTFNFNST